MTHREPANARKEPGRVWAALLCVLAGVPAWAGELNLTFRFDPRDLRVAQVGGYARVLLKGGALPEDEPGSPWLPMKPVNALLPAGARG